MVEVMSKSGRVLLSFMTVLGGAFLAALPLELCWNYLVSTEFIPWRQVTYWQAWCAVYVARSVLVTTVNDYGKAE